MNLHRPSMIARLREEVKWDVCIIGGGATGLGIAFEAASSGISTLLIERDDFAKGTSSRSTKLLHGGVRYLEQGKIALVKEALRERDRVLHNAAGHVQSQGFVIPVKQRWRQVYYGLGLLCYDLLSGRRKWGRTTALTSAELREKFPKVADQGAIGGLRYSDGKFDDVGLALSLAKAAADKGAVLVNHCSAVGINKTEGTITGVTVKDHFSGKSHDIQARVVINACGPFGDALCRLDDPHHENRLQPSQGIHLVFDGEVMPGEDAVLIPKTDDGRILFAVPWMGKVLVGTTDTALDEVTSEPLAQEDEIDFVLDHANRHLGLQLKRADIRSVFAGLRPLIKGRKDETSDLSRSHDVSMSPSGLINVHGGKWTTYRKMAEDTLAFIRRKKRLDFSPADTRYSRIVEGPLPDRIHVPQGDDELRTAVVKAVDEEMCATVEDFLARRFRTLFLDAKHAISLAPQVAILLAETQGFSAEWAQKETASFQQLAQGYLPQKIQP